MSSVDRGELVRVKEGRTLYRVLWLDHGFARLAATDACSSDMYITTAILERASPPEGRARDLAEK